MTRVTRQVSICFRRGRLELELAIHAQVQAEKDLRCKLVGIGCVKTKDATVQGAIVSLFILIHPDIQKTKSYAEQMRNDHQQTRNLNLDAWQQVIDRLEFLKRRAVGL